ncbi:MAG: zinc-dependent metalloprotease [Solirubrobacteraceae bacterium]
MDAIDWSTAQRVGELIAGSPKIGGPPGGRALILDETVQPLALQFARRVSDYSGLAFPDELPPLEAVDRSRWIAANLQTMRPILESFAEQAGGKRGRRPRRNWKRPGQDLGPLYDALGAAGGLLLGAQVGAMAGLLSQRVLGQYDLALLDPSVTPRLLLVAPNLAQAAHNMQVDREQLLAWVTIHEITHAVQFSGAPWLREHLAGLLRELIEGLQVTVSLGALLRLPGDARALAERLRHGELVRLTLGEERWRLVERLQATMSLVEGHAEHVMDAVGAEVLPSLPRLRAAMTRRRVTRGLPWRVLERLLGLELKLRQYEEGRRFCDAVVLAGGPSALARAWRSADDLPTAAELQAPDTWLARTG